MLLNLKMIHGIKIDSKWQEILYNFEFLVF